MKMIGIFGVAVTASIALLQPAQGRSQGSTHSFSPAQHYSAPAAHFSGHPRSFSGGNAQYYRSSPRFSSQTAFRNRAYPATGPQLAVNRTTALNPRTYSSSGPQLAAARDWIGAFRACVAALQGISEMNFRAMACASIALVGMFSPLGTSD